MAKPDMKMIEEAIKYMEKVSKIIDGEKGEHIKTALLVLTALKDGKLVDSNLVPKLAKEIALKLTALASKVAKPVVTEEWLDRVLPKAWSNEYTYPLEPNDYQQGEVNGANKMLADCREAMLK